MKNETNAIWEISLPCASSLSSKEFALECWTTSFVFCFSHIARLWYHFVTYYSTQSAQLLLSVSIDWFIYLLCSRCILQSDMKPGNTPHFSCSTHTFLWPLNPNDPQVLYYCCKPLLCCLTRWKKHAACKAPMKGCQDEVRHEHLISQREFQETEHYFTTWKLSGQWDPVYNQRGWGIYLIDCTSPGTSLVL